MISRQVAVTPRDAKLIVRYLDSVDDVVTARLAAGFSPHEDHLSALLCEMLDDNQSALHTLSYSLASLRTDLALDPNVRRVHVTVESRKYSPHIERRLTSSDIGVVVKYTDNVQPRDSFTRGALFQAKRLYASATGRAYSVDDSFKEFDLAQLQRLNQIETRLASQAAQVRGPSSDVIPGAFTHHGLCHYLFYCPRIEHYDALSTEAIQRNLIPGDGYFDYSFGLHLYEFASDPGRHVPGLLASRLDWLLANYSGTSQSNRGVRSGSKTKPTVREVFERLWNEVTPFSWFIVYGMLLGGAGSSEKAGIDLVRGASVDEDADLPVAPRYVLTVEVQVGSVRG
jgi:hypothetical protein